MTKGPESDSAPSDQRSGSRRRVLFPGLIVFGNGVYTFDCVIRNLSAEGARISVAPHIHIPERFYLINIRDGRAYDAFTVWQRENEFGARLGPPIPLRGNADPQHDRLKDLWLAKAPR